MYRRIVAGIKLALGLHHPGSRNLKIYEDDVFLVSYPKSGNTWTRFLVCNLLHPDQPADFSNIDELIPDPEGLSKRHLAQLPRPRVIKSHQYFHPAYSRVVYIVRDPRDVAVSQYHFRRKRRVIADELPIEEFLPDFLSGAYSPYGSWGENVASWLSTRSGDPNFLLLRYKDMVANTVAELAKIAEFLRIDADEARLALAAERSSADRMRKLEKQQPLSWSTTRDTRQDLPFVRAARTGSWKHELPESCVSEIERRWGHIMSHLGYSLASRREVRGESAQQILLGGTPR